MGWWSALAGIGTSASNFVGTRAQNRENREISQRQMDFQAHMSNTAYQRAMSDMKTAGLNPILAYKTGGASTPSGASIPAQNELAGAAAAGTSAYSAMIQARNVQANTEKLQYEADLARLKRNRFRDYGDSPTGTNLDSLRKIGRNVTSTVEKKYLPPKKGFRTQNYPSPPTSAKSLNNRYSETPVSRFMKRAKRYTDKHLFGR